MGLDPNDDSYPAGNECGICVDELFGGTTPNFILAIIQDIVKCPGIPPGFGEPPNGAFCIPQIDNCRWSGMLDANNSLDWQLLPAESRLYVNWPGFSWFKNIIADKCYDAFLNDNVCGVGLAIGSGGYVTLWWGPQICKDPCS